MQKALNSFTISVYSFTQNMWNTWQWTFKKYFHKHLDAWGLVFGPFHWMRFLHTPVWKPEAKWRREKQEDGIIEKDSQKGKEQTTRDREADRLKCKYSQKKEREGDWHRIRMRAIYLSIGLRTVLLLLSWRVLLPQWLLKEARCGQ